MKARLHSLKTSLRKAFDSAEITFQALEQCAHDMREIQADDATRDGLFRDDRNEAAAEFKKASSS